MQNIKGVNIFSFPTLFQNYKEDLLTKSLGTSQICSLNRGFVISKTSIDITNLRGKDKNVRYIEVIANPLRTKISLCFYVFFSEQRQSLEFFDRI